MSIGELKRMRSAGFTYKEIGNIAGIPWSTVRSRCKSLGVKPNPDLKIFRSHPRRPDYDYPYWLIYEMYWKCELSTNDIAYELVLARGTVEKMMRRLGIPFRTRAEAWELMRRRDRMPPRRVLTTGEAVRMARLSAEKRREASSNGN